MAQGAGAASSPLVRVAGGGGESADGPSDHQAFQAFQALLCHDALSRPGGASKCQAAIARGSIDGPIPCVLTIPFLHTSIHPQFLKRSLAETEQGSGLGLPRQVTICGGGNGAHVTAGYLGWKGIKVRWRDLSCLDRAA